MAPFGLGTWHTIAVTVAGAALTVHVDGTELGTVTDPAPLTAGGIAFGTRDAVVLFDDLRVTAP